MERTPKTPLADAVMAARAAGLRPMQIPGHKYRYLSADSDAPGADLLYPLVRDDVPLQAGADDNSFSHGWLGQAERLYADAIGAAHTRFLVNGGSQGNMSALLAVGGDGLRVAVDRTSHRSALSGLILSGSMPEWIYPERHPEFGIPIGVSGAALTGLSEVCGVFVTSPSYLGTMSEVSEIALAAHSLGAPLVVDQAWGAHLDFGVAGHPSALAAGADIVVTSVHKALMGYSQTAVISCQGGLVSTERLDLATDMTMTTSPSATLLGSIDATRAVMQQSGSELIDRAIEACDAARRLLRAVPGVVVLDDDNAGCAVDPLKLVLWLPRTGCVGTELAAALWELGHGCESADIDTLIMTICVTDHRDDLLEVVAKIAALIEANRSEPRAPAPSAVWGIRPEVAMSPRAAAFAPRERVAISSSVGRVCAEQFTPYPPGVPLIGPGEVVTEEVVAAIAIAGRNGRVAYCSDQTLQSMEVIR